MISRRSRFPLRNAPVELVPADSVAALTVAIISVLPTALAYELGALLVAAGLGAAAKHALVSLLELNGL
jgi:hypothetical protein